MSIAPWIFLGTGRLFADSIDLTVYFTRGSWIIDRLPMISEYPPIPTLLFGVDRLLISMFDERVQGIFYIMLFSAEMILILFLTYRTVIRLISYNLFATIIMLLPPVIYFTYSRLDILPTFLSLVAYFYVTREKWGWAGFWLGVATLTKWYPALLFPGYFVYGIYKGGKKIWLMLPAFLGAVILIMGLTYLQGGWVSVVSPYIFHLRRGMEFIALPKLIYGQVVRFISVSSQAYYTIFFILQICMPVILAIFGKIDSQEKLAYYSIVVISMFIIFARIWSPQWFLWLIPFMVLLVKNWRDVIEIAIFNGVVYLSFPVVFDIFGANSNQLVIVGLVYYGMLCMFIVRSLLMLDISIFPTLIRHLHPTLR